MAIFWCKAFTSTRLYFMILHYSRKDYHVNEDYESKLLISYEAGFYQIFGDDHVSTQYPILLNVFEISTKGKCLKHWHISLLWCNYWMGTCIDTATSLYRSVWILSKHTHM